MAEFTITKVLPEVRTWESAQFGTFNIYDVEFEGAEARGRGQIKTKATSPPPTEGMTGNFELVRKGDFPVELKRIKDQPNNGAHLGRARDPLETKRIVRQHSQKIALMYIQAKVAAGEKLQSKTDPEKPFTFEEVRALTDRFQADIEGVS